MPRMTRVWIKTALAYLLIGTILGGWLLAALIRILDPSGLLPAAQDLMGVGYMLMLIAGLAIIGSVWHRVGFVPSTRC